jgi:hypothetical protein
MELIYSLIPTTLYSFFKISFILFLFIINIYLILTHDPEKTLSKEDKQQGEIIQAGFNNKKFKGWLGTLSTFGGFVATYITLKNEFKDIQIGKLDQLMKEDRDNIRRSIDKDREELQGLVDTINSKREELQKLYGEQTKIFGSNDRLLTLHNSIKDKVHSFKDKSIDPDAKLYELGVLDQLIKLDVNKFTKEIDSLIASQVEPTLSDGSNDPTTSKNEEEVIDSQATSDLKESSVFNFDIFYYLDWFESLNGIKKLAISLIISKSVIFSALLSIIFIFYGDILIKKYDLENKYPKLAYIIQLRREFQKIYFKYNCFLILSVIIIEVIFALAVLFLL